MKKRHLGDNDKSKASSHNLESTCIILYKNFKSLLYFSSFKSPTIHIVFVSKPKQTNPKKNPMSKDSSNPHI